MCRELKGLCNYYPLPMDSTDPVWFGVGGLSDICESAVNHYGFYVPTIEVGDGPYELLRCLMDTSFCRNFIDRQELIAEISPLIGRPRTSTASHG